MASCCGLRLPILVTEATVTGTLVTPSLPPHYPLAPGWGRGRVTVVAGPSSCGQGGAAPLPSEAAVSLTQARPRRPARPASSGDQWALGGPARVTSTSGQHLQHTRASYESSR